MIKQSIVLFPLLALLDHAAAAPVTKAPAGTDLTLGASWGGTAPTSSDVATWINTSLGPALTMPSSQTWDGIDVQGATGAIDITGTGTLTLGASGINIAAAGQNLTLAAPRTFNATSTITVGTGRTLTLGGAVASTTTFAAGTVTSLSGSGILSIGGAAAHTITGSGALSIGSGFTLLNNFQAGSSSAGYSGAVTLSSGGFYYQGSTLPALGTGLLTINGGTIGSNTGTGARAVSNPTLIGGNFTLANTGGSTSVTTFSGNMDLGGATRSITANMGSGQGTIISGLISNGGLNVDVASTGFLTLSNNGNTFAGPTTVDRTGATGGLAISTGALANSSSVTLNGNARFFIGVNGVTTINNLSGASGANIRSDFTITGGAGNRDLQVTQTVDGTYAGTFVEGSATRPIGLIKEGAATLTLTGNLGGIAGYTRPTVINNGTLKINGSTAAGSAVSVNANGTLAGTGTANGSVTVNGTLSPGNSAGTFNIGSTLTLNSGSKLAYELGAVGGSNDLTTVTGAVTVNAATTLNITGGAGYDTASSGGGIYTLIDSAASITGAPSNVTVGSGAPVNNAYVVTTNAANATLNLALIEHAEASWSAASDVDSGSTHFGTLALNTASSLDSQNLIALDLPSTVAALLDASAGGSVTGDVSLFSVSSFGGFSDAADGTTGATVSASFLGAPAPGTYSVTLTLPKSLFSDDATAFSGLAGHTLGAVGGLDSTGASQSGDLTWTWTATVVPEPSGAGLLLAAATLGLHRRRR